MRAYYGLLLALENCEINMKYLILLLGVFALNAHSKSLGGIVNVQGEDGKSKYSYSLLPHDDIFEKGLVSEAIAGQFHGDIDDLNGYDGSNFVANPKFVELLHQVIRINGPKLDSLIVEANRQKNGVVAVIDRRVKDQSMGVVPEDIIGLFEVKNSVIGAYKGNSNYILWTNKGFSDLPKELVTPLLIGIRAAYN